MASSSLMPRRARRAATVSPRRTRSWFANLFSGDVWLGATGASVDVDDDGRTRDGVGNGARRDPEGRHDAKGRDSEQESTKRHLPCRQNRGDALR